MAGIPTIILGQSGENTAESQIQVWRKRSIPTVEAARRSVFAEHAPWFICVVLAVLFVLEHILVLWHSNLAKQEHD